jgi:serine/threonine protein kinase
VVLARSADVRGEAGPPKTPFGDAESVKRFLTEARAVAELDHPNVLPLLDYGVVEAALYYAMPVVDGASLEERLRESLAAGTVPPLRFSLGVARSVALALDAAHRRGICHRDVKPGNVLLERDGTPKLIVFGLARIARLGDSAWAEGVIVGTPYYMPPEQALGDMEKVDALSDVYSLGAVLYELVSGTPPYAELSPEAVPSVLAARPPARLSAVAPRAPRPVVDLVERAMDARRDRRFESAAQFAAAIAAAEVELPPEAA